MAGWEDIFRFPKGWKSGALVTVIASKTIDRSAGMQATTGLSAGMRATTGLSAGLHATTGLTKPLTE